ncbi:hypothetical protein D3C75_910290 [compost metagenome]
MLFRDAVLAHINLDFTAKILDVGEAGFSHYPFTHDTAGNAYFQSELVQFFFGLSVILSQKVSGSCCTLIFLTERVDSQRTQLVQFCTANLQQLAKLFLRVLHGIQFLGHVRSSSLKPSCHIHKKKRLPPNLSEGSPFQYKI